MNSKQRRQKQKAKELINLGRQAAGQINALEGELELARRETASLNKSFLQTRQVNTSIQNQLDASLNEVARLEALLTKSEEDKEAMLGTMAEERATFQATIVERLENEQFLTKERDGLLQDMKNLRELVKEKETENAPLKNQIATLEAELKPFRKRLYAKSKENEKLREMIGALRSKLSKESQGISIGYEQPPA